MNSPLRTAMLAAVSALSLAACDSGPTKPELTVDLSEARAQITSLQDEVTSLTADIAALNGEVAALEAENEDFSAQISALTTQRNTLNTQLSTLQASFDALTADRDALSVSLAQTESALNVAQDQIADLTDDLATLQLEYDNYNKTAFNNLNDRTVYNRTVETALADVTAAETDVQDAVAASDAADADLQEAQDLFDWGVENSDFGVLTLSSALALYPEQAALYAAIVGLDVESDEDQSALIDGELLVAAIEDLALESIAASDAVDAANDTLLNVRVAYNDQFGGSEVTDETILYRADGSAIAAAGAAFFGQPDAAAVGDKVPVVARLTALFLLDENGTPVDMLVWEASGSPFVAQPVGDAVFQSESMIAFFAQKEGDQYVLAGQDDAGGSLTLDFGQGSGQIVVRGIENGDNQDFAIAARLTFDPETGEFTGTGNQSYTTEGGEGGAELAAAEIAGNLWGDAEAFTALIEATDVTAGAVNVTIYTAVGGNGRVGVVE